MNKFPTSEFRKPPANNPTTIEGSVRPDGTIRKAIKIRPGYIPQEEIPKYTVPSRRVNVKILMRKNDKNSWKKNNKLM